MSSLGHMERVCAVATHERVWAFGGTRTGASSAITVVSGDKVRAHIELDTHTQGIVVTREGVFATCQDGSLRGFTHAGKPMFSVPAHGVGRTVVALAAGGKKLVTAGADGVVRRWSATDGTPDGAWTLSSAALYAVAVDPSGEVLAAAGADGVVRTIALANGARREMQGHDGAVRALAFTPRDGRLASAGDDGIVRIWYLVGAIECETRGADQSGHQGAVRALAFAPFAREDGHDVGDRLYSAGDDGVVKIWRLEDRKRTRAIELESAPALALAFGAPPKDSPEGSSTLFVGYHHRVVQQIELLIDAEGECTRHGPLIDELFSQLWSPRPSREAAVRALAEMDEPEASEHLIEVISHNDMDPVRALAITEAAAHGRRKVRPQILTALEDDDEAVQRAAFDGLRVLDGTDSVAPMQAALAVSPPELKVIALDALAALGLSTPAVPGLLVRALSDDETTVRLRALALWLKVHPDTAEALRVAYEKCTSDMRQEVLAHAARKGLLGAPTLASTVARALDDDDDDVRRTAFAALVLARRALCRALEDEDPVLKVALQDLLRRVAQQEGDAARTPSDKEIRAARKAVPGVDTGGAPTEDDKHPLLTAIACRSAETAMRGACGLALLGDLRALGALLQLSREPSDELRIEAAGALARLHDGRARRRLESMFDDENADVRAAARTAYSGLEGVDALKVATVALRAAQPDIRVQGLSEVVKHGRSEATQALLEEALEDESGLVRAEAFRAMWSWHARSPEPALTRALQGRFPDVRLRAVNELAALQSKPWARTMLQGVVQDRDASVAWAALQGIVKSSGASHPPTVVLAMGAHDMACRSWGAGAAVKCPPETVLPTLTTLLADEQGAVRLSALRAIDALQPNDAATLREALGSARLDVKLLAAECLARRHDESIIEPLRALLADEGLAKTLEQGVHHDAMVRAATALATLGARSLLGYFTEKLLTHTLSAVQIEGARGLAMAAQAGDELYLVHALTHATAWVRWRAADGLARLGDIRSLPVLTGNQKYDDTTVRQMAFAGFAALGDHGIRGVLAGLEDPSPRIQAVVFAVILARDLRAHRAGEAPELLVSALSSQRPEVRYAAARAIELRSDLERYVTYVVETLSPPRGDRAATPKGFPPWVKRSGLMVALAEALAGDRAEERYAAVHALLLRDEHERFFREVERVVAPRTAGATWIADTEKPRGEGTEPGAPRDWLRRLFSHDPVPAPKARTAEEHALRQLAFGAYVGLLRQTSTEGEGHRVRRDTIDRLVELSAQEGIGHDAVVAALKRALEDEHHLVRKAALDGLRRVFASGATEPLSFALMAASEDVGRAALDELGAQGQTALPRIASALNSSLAPVRWHAFRWLEKLAGRESLEPLLLALASDHADLRIGVIERLASSRDPRVTDALVRATASDRDDLRLRAGELLARRHDTRAVDALAGFLRSDEQENRTRAIRALAMVGSPAAVDALGVLLSDTDERDTVAEALAEVRGEAALDALIGRLDDEDEDFRATAFESALSVLGREPAQRNDAWALRLLCAAVQSRDPTLRRRACEELGDVNAHAADAVIAGLFADRGPGVRQAAVQAYSRRVLTRNAPVAPMEQVLREGARELVLPAAEAVASKGIRSALQTLLLVARAGEPEEQPRAVLALGSLGDVRALAELETLSLGGTEEAPVEPALRVAAIEALGRIAPKLTDSEAQARLVDRVEQSTASADLTLASAGVRGLRWIGGDRARSLLETIVLNRSAQNDLRVAAARELGELGSAASEDALVSLLQDTDGWDAKTPYDALRKVFPHERTRVELHALKACDAEYTERAASFLAREGEAAGLVARLPDVAPELRQRLLFGLLRRGAAPVEPLAALLAHAAPEVRADAAWLIGARVAVPEQSAETPWNQADRATLADALASAEEALASRWTTLPTAQRGAEERAWSQITWALAALRQPAHAGRLRALAGSDPLAVPSSVVTQARRAGSEAVKEKTVHAMVSARDVEGLLTRLKAATDDADRREILDALGRVGDGRARALIGAMAFDKQATEPLRKAAYRALRRVLRSARRTERVEA